MDKFAKKEKERYELIPFKLKWLKIISEEGLERSLQSLIGSSLSLLPNEGYTHPSFSIPPDKYSQYTQIKFIWNYKGERIRGILLINASLDPYPFLLVSIIQSLLPNKVEEIVFFFFFFFFFFFYFL
jgi:hypothetical protein